MSYRKETSLSKNYSTRERYGHGSKIVGVTLHHWGGDGQKHANVVSWLRGYTGNSNSSAHYVASDGLVTQLVPDDKAAWHAGNNQGNGTTIGIECRPEMSAGDWATLVELCQDLEKEHGSLKYYRHKDWKNTACPGRYSSRIGELVKAINGSSSTKPAKPKPKPAKPYPLPAGHYYYTESRDKRVHSGYWNEDRPAIREIQRAVKTHVDGGYGRKTKACVEREQKKLGIKVDGAAGPDTWGALF